MGLALRTSKSAGNKKKDSSKFMTKILTASDVIARSSLSGNGPSSYSKTYQCIASAYNHTLTEFDHSITSGQIFFGGSRGTIATLVRIS